MILRRGARRVVSETEKGEFVPSNETVDRAAAAAGYEPQGQA
ncbi:MAG: hypothetical protein ACLFQ5_02725 [Oceanicaulis sp.]